MKQKNQDIKDIPSLKKLKNDVHGMRILSKTTKFFEKLGIKNTKFSNVLDKFPELEKITKEIIELPDRFNNHFSKHGWIAYESMNFELMKNTVNLADKEKLEEAEAILVEQFDESNLDFNLMKMKAIQEYLIREDLIKKAMTDYLSERYHACIPVILSLIDGIVNDIEQKGFFAQGVDLTAWDSIAAHSSGLQELAKIFNKKRKKTTAETITVPYRHGIIHGRDLGYDNKIVAAKSWAALFAIRDWALAVRNKGENQKNEEEARNILESLKKMAETESLKKKIKKWEPRKIEIGRDCPRSGEPKDYAKGSPERAIVEFLLYWQNRNYGLMAHIIKTFRDEPIKKFAGYIRELFQAHSLKSFSLIRIADFAPAAAEIEVELNIMIDEKEIKKSSKVRLIHENEQGNPQVMGAENGIWKIPVYSIYSLVS
jgi:hypothetical protein